MHDVNCFQVINLYSRYIEATPVLYSTNTFEFQDLDTFLGFTSHISPSAWNITRTIHLRVIDGFMLPAICGTLKWQRVATVLATMQGLQQLLLHLDHWSYKTHPPIAEQETKILSPLMDVKRVKRFVVNVGWKVLEDSDESKSKAPFDLHHAVVIRDRMIAYGPERA